MRCECFDKQHPPLFVMPFQTHRRLLTQRISFYDGVAVSPALIVITGTHLALHFRPLDNRCRNSTIPNIGLPEPMTASQTTRNTRAVIAHCVDDLHQYLRARLNCEQDAQDIAQEACLKMLQFRYAASVENPRAYLYRIACNLLSQHYRRRRLAISEMEVDLLPSAQPAMEEQTITRFRQRQVERAVAELSLKCRIAMTLRWREGLRVDEIAKHMDLSRGMVKKYLASGMAHTRKRLRRFALADRAL